LAEAELVGVDEQAHMPIYIAAMGESNLRLTGQYADGWLPLLIPCDALADSLATVHDAVIRAGRPPDSIDSAPFVPTCISNDEPAACCDKVRSMVAFYVGAMGEFYYRTVKRFSHDDLADAIRDAWTTGDHSGAQAVITDEALGAFAACGTPESAAETLLRYREASADMPVAYIPPRTSDRLVRETLGHL